MRIKVPWVAVLIMMVMVSCGQDKSTETNPPDDNPNDVVNFPFSESFDSGEDDVCLKWSAYFCPGHWIPSAGSVYFQYDTLQYASPHASLSAFLESGQQYGGYSGEVFFGSTLDLRRNLVLTDKTQASLTFNNIRAIAGTLPLPQPLQGEENDAYCYLDASINGGSTWTPLVHFSSSAATWSMESVSLTSLVGHEKVRLRFRLPQHASGSVSTRWLIDDVTIVAN